ncbi:unnamed protein product [Rhizophagus irregularis]|uniref:GRAM domain-containing protein n=1 Tax=Rhizophagus irregularis TaxID=588596 RepID=A0A2I1FWU7_9GLOM|nr:hypothetical protein RhiirA4_181798 [Rhizophagus irregularis]CAB4405587.1 unnamed protein product [Rhizophagus irregularis]
MSTYINSLETKFHENTKIPVPLAGESYFHRHQPIKFKVVIEGTTIKEYSATGKIFLTDKRLMFIAQEPLHNFETFHVMLKDVYSSIKSPPPRFKKKKVFSVRINIGDEVLIISLRYKSKNLGDKKIFEDYYSMLVRV